LAGGAVGLLLATAVERNQSVFSRLRVAGRRREDGASAVEYGLLVAAIAAVIAIVVFALGGLVKTALYDKTCTNIKNGAQLTTATCS